jgi:lysophospholipase L1-like esterase
VKTLATFAFVLGAALCGAADKERTYDPTKWESTIVKFEQSDQKSPPPADAAVFVGSSSFTTWKNMQSYFLNDKVINRGFGASVLADVNHYVDRIVIKYKPRIIVMYCGGNDMAVQGHSPERVLESFRTFVNLVREKLPETPIVYISMHWPPGRPNQKDKILQANKLLAAECAAQNHVTFLDLHDDMLGPDGQPNKELYKDYLHPGPKGYEIWVKKLEPLLAATRPAQAPKDPQRGNAAAQPGGEPATKSSPHPTSQRDPPPAQSGGAR